MKFVKAIIPLVISAFLVLFLNSSWGTIPPLAKLFSPFYGFLQNTERGASLENKSLELDGITGKVTVKWDENHVPHIFAENDEDLYFAQGYVIASDRLWQMEFYTLVAAGRLTEVVGERALAYDQYNRSLGMAKAAKQISENLQNDPDSWKVLTAYSAGVNQLIKDRECQKLSVEYKFLNYKPEQWSPYKTILMLMNMRKDLSGRSYDSRMTTIAQKYGLETVADLFPNYPADESPIIPAGTPWNFTPVAIPAVPDEVLAFTDSENALAMLPEPNKGIGSNNWAVSGSKSASGLPILSNDPHLGLSLPSIWYQMQLSSPSVNVYGSCLPGTPGVTIGFNKDIAWGVTNVGSDVMDYYKIKFKDNTKSEYFHDGKWKPVAKRIETYRIKGGKAVVDTVLETHHGPIIYDESKESNFSDMAPAGYAMRWVALDTDGSDLMTFHKLNRAKNYADYQEALTYYTCPAQNFVFASNQNDIAITPNGKFPVKWEGQGKFLLDGTRADHDWQGFIPKDQNPTVKNPARGFVSSANQFSTDPTYPYYMDWRFADPYRGQRINERLTQMQNANIDSLRSVQNDNYNMAAREFIPFFLENVIPNDKNKAALGIIKKWDFRNEADAVGATIFEEWMDLFMFFTWNDDLPKDKNMMYPTEDRTYEMLKNSPNSKWWDDISTQDKLESAKDIINKSFIASIDSLTLHNGPLSPDTWAWEKIKSTDVKHLVPAFTSFSRMDLNNGGGWRIVNATTAKTGPSWRMIVALDKDWPQAYGLYPGGQSGNPGSKFYDNMVDKWTAGELNELLFMKNVEDTKDRISTTWTINPKK
ncbi:penicillin amidase [Spirosomataceae bacterium TFI 002]|nr:penicillin amidase [Spirosomataceae bacterium TFI 002]